MKCMKTVWQSNAVMLMLTIYTDLLGNYKYCSEGLRKMSKIGTERFTHMRVLPVLLIITAFPV